MGALMIIACKVLQLGGIVIDGAVRDTDVLALADGRLALRQQIALEAGWKRADLGVVVFVQNKASGEILQALQRHTCPG